MQYTAKDIQKQFEKLKDDRAVRDGMLQRIAYYTVPTKAYFLKDKQVLGEKLPSDIYDTTGIDSVMILAAALHGYLTNPSSRWFEFEMQDKETNQISEVKQWLSDAQRETYDVLNGSNFNQQIHETYVDLVSLAASPLFMDEDVKTTVRFSCRPLYECYFMEDENERVNRMYRKFPFTAIQAYSKWKDKCGKTILKAIQQQEFSKPFNFIHLVCPRDVYDPSKDDAFNMPFASYYVNLEDKIIVEEGGYHEFPFAVPRYSKLPDDPYGYSPGWTAFADIKTANRQQYVLLRAGEKAVDPPLVLPHDGFILPIKLNAAALNYRLPGTLPTDKIEPIMSGQNLPIGLDHLKHTQEQIKTKFHTDLFLMMLDDRQRTAQEIMQRVSDRMLILGPVIGRLMTELLEPVISRTLNICIRRGRIKQPPDAIKGKNFIINYLGPLAKAQKSADLQAITALLAVTNSVMAVKPEVSDKIDTDKIIDEVADIVGVDPELVRDDDEVKKDRDARAEMQQQQMQLAMLQAGANIAKTGSETHKNVSDAQKTGK